MKRNLKHKKRNFRNLKPIKNLAFFITLILSVIFLSFFIISSASCSMNATPAEKIDVDRGSEEQQGQSEETISLEEEEVVQIDYQNATIGAEMVGAIPSFLCTNRDNIIIIEITNTSDFTWRTEKPGVVRIGYHYYGQDVEYVDYDQTSRSLLPNPVNPGETVTVEVLINNIENEGNYVIQIDPVLEGNERPEDNFWFSSKGVEMMEGTSYVGSCGE